MPIEVPLLKFRPHIKRKIVENGPTLNVKNITSFGFQVVVGHDNLNETGFSALVVDQIWAKP